MPGRICSWFARQRSPKIARPMESGSIMRRRRCDLASEDAQADRGVDQHQREYEEPLSPEHEGKAGVGRRGLVDRDRERNHVRPERDRERGERSSEDSGHHIDWRSVTAAPNVCREHDRRQDADRGKDQQIRPLEPSAHYGKILDEREGEDDNQEDEQSKRQKRYLAIGCVANVRLAFPDEPAGAEKRIAEAETEAAQHREGAEPAEHAADVPPIVEGKSLDERSDRHALDEGGEKRSAGKTGIPNPPQPLGLVAEFESDTSQDQAREHHEQREIERREQRRINDGKGAPEHDADDDQPSLVAIPDRSHGAQHGAPSRLVASQAE